MSAKGPTLTSPASSPPRDEVNGKEATSSEAMQHEEEELAHKRREEQAKSDIEMDKRRNQDLNAGKGHIDNNYKNLEWLLTQATVWNTLYLASEISSLANMLTDVVNCHALPYAEGRRSSQMGGREKRWQGIEA
jgi:hypothetical protein